MNFIRHNWGYIFLLPFIFLGFSLLAAIPFQADNSNYDISYSHITGQVIALENTSYGTKVILNGGGLVTLADRTQLIIGTSYDFTYANYTLKVDNWWNHFIGTKPSGLVRFDLK